MTNQTRSLANSFDYWNNRQVFNVVRTSAKVFLSTSKEGVSETRELHVTTMPESKNIKNEFGPFVFRLVETEAEQKTDRQGHPIVGGVNYSPEPAHAVIFVSPLAMSMLSAKISSNSCSISCCPCVDLAEWTREDFNPIYEVNFSFG